MEKQEEERKEDGENIGVVFDLNNLPEGCISNILSLTSPKDACRSSLVSSSFKSAADSDTLWEKFLPSNYKEIMPAWWLVKYSSKKELYNTLCHNPILIDGGLKSFSLDICSGKKCFMLGAKDLAITWGSIPQYWKWTEVPNSRFPEVAQLITVGWLEIRGKLRTGLLSPNTLYLVYFVFKFVEDAYGFNNIHSNALVKVVGGGSNPCSGRRHIYWDSNGNSRRKLGETSHDLQFPQERGDGWLKIEMGHFFNDGREDDKGEVHMILTEINGGQAKGGLIVEGIELRPK